LGRVLIRRLWWLLIGFIIAAPEGSRSSGAPVPLSINVGPG
jgi:hypothetical protein